MMNTFSLRSKYATSISILFFDLQTKKQLFCHPLKKNDTLWEITLDLTPPLLYLYKVSGPKESPYFFNPEKLLIDPTNPYLIKEERYYSLFSKKEDFDWQGVKPPQIEKKDLIIYEMHVRGFTSSKTFLGVIEKIPYLLSLGINAVELLPVHLFDPENNYWGYNSLSFFAPMPLYAKGEPITEFKTMVRELHRNGIEVLLDVVYNHTGESLVNDKIYSLLGIDRVSYYALDEKGDDTNDSGCKNTLQFLPDFGKELLLKSLRFWKEEMRVDGFRFDLAPILAPCIASITEEIDAKLIAEPWDAAGHYMLGQFPSSWSEWNDQYRDHVRQFFRGDSGSKNAFATSLSGSSPIFKNAVGSINFITAHDGFTLYDLTSYTKKRNESNGEKNQDGSDSNLSFNCGVEGETQDVVVNALRIKQMKNMFLALFLSKGIPMLQMGDEYGHTKKGNNNSYCHDSELNWFNNKKLEENRELFHFVEQCTALRKRFACISSENFYTEENISWFGPKGSIDWEEKTPFLAFFLEKKLFAVFNQSEQDVEITLPSTGLSLFLASDARCSHVLMPAKSTAIFISNS